MSDRLSDRPCDTREDWLELLVDSELEPTQEAYFRGHIESCHECRGELDLALRVQQELRSLPELDAPPQVIRSILDRAREKPWYQRILDRLRMGLPTPAWAALGAAAALVMMAVLIPRSSESPRPAVDAEVARATEEARIALAWVGGLTRKTAHQIRDEVLVERVVDPTSQALGGRALGGRALGPRAPTRRPAAVTVPGEGRQEITNDSPGGERSG